MNGSGAVLTGRWLVCDRREKTGGFEPPVFRSVDVG
jgi:hypothetical protein